MYCCAISSKYYCAIIVAKNKYQLMLQVTAKKATAKPAAAKPTRKPAPKRGDFDGDSDSDMEFGASKKVGKAKPRKVSNRGVVVVVVFVVFVP